MKPILRLLLLYGVLENVLGNSETSESLSEVISDSATDLLNNRFLKQKFLIPYVRNVYNHLDSSKINTVSGNVRFLIPKEDLRVDGTRRQNLVFNTSEILQNKMTTARLVVSTDKMDSQSSISISHRFYDIPTKYTPFGFVADVTDCIRTHSERETFTVILSRLTNPLSTINTILAVFEDFSLDDVSALESVDEVVFDRLARSIDELPITEPVANATFNPHICSVKPWEVNFNELGWSGWLLLPASYEANACKGVCPTPFTHQYYNASGHAIIKNSYHVATNYEHVSIVPRACCVPNKFDPLQIVYLTKTGSAKMKFLKKMKVKSCSCM